MQRYGVPIHRIQYGINFVHVNGKDSMVKWNLGSIMSADNLELLMLCVELGLEPR